MVVGKENFNSHCNYSAREVTILKLRRLQDVFKS